MEMKRISKLEVEIGGGGGEGWHGKEGRSGGSGQEIVAEVNARLVKLITVVHPLVVMILPLKGGRTSWG